jgi:hypothetical protein
VRTVEQGDRNESPLSFRRVDPGGSGTQVRIGTFSGAWNTGQIKTVTFKYSSNTPNTVSAINLFLDLPSDGAKDCVIMKERGTWHLIQWQWVTVTCAE